MPSLSERVAATLGTFPDFPKPGIVFKDIAPVLADPALLQEILDWCHPPEDVGGVVALDARGFMFGVPLALALGVPFIMCRKAGKLPGECGAVTYDLEYGTATVELQKGALADLGSVVVVDVLLATGGTAIAAINLVRKQGCSVYEAIFITELGFLDGRKRLENIGVYVRSLAIL